MTLYEIFREAPVGQLARLLTGDKVFKYPEELPGFEIPWKALSPAGKEAVQDDSSASTPLGTSTPHESGDVGDNLDIERLAQIATIKTIDRSRQQLTRETTLGYTPERLQAEEQAQLDRQASAIIIPTKTSDGITLIDWYSTDDTANPQNWSGKRKFWTTLIICWYSFVAYLASAIYISSIPGVIRRFEVSSIVASLGLSLYVLGYGTGPLLFSPLSELAAIGRNPPYIISFALFVILAVPTALSDSFATLMGLRFITGFMSSPALATGGASMQDMYSLLKLPYGLTAWVAATFSAPALGPLLSGFAVMNKNWRWSLWEILWIAGPTWLVMFCFMPETSASTILLRRAQRLRKLTGEQNFRAKSEIDQGASTFRQIAAQQLIKPIEISIKDPAVMFTNIYTSFVYGVYYSFFEVFPLVYGHIYGFNLGIIGLPFLTIIVGCMIGVVIYVAYQWLYLEPDIKKNGLRAQEHRLVPALFAVFLLPSGLFWFAWTANAHTHWIVPTIGLTLFPSGAFIVVQAISMYLPLTFPEYAASLFASNDLCRASVAAGSIMFAHPLFGNLGVGRGVSLLGGLLVGGIIGMWALWYWGASLRARSKFAAS